MIGSVSVLTLILFDYVFFVFLQAWRRGRLVKGSVRDGTAGDDAGDGSGRVWVQYLPLGEGLGGGGYPLGVLQITHASEASSLEDNEEEGEGAASGERNFCARWKWLSSLLVGMYMSSSSLSSEREREKNRPTQGRMVANVGDALSCLVQVIKVWCFYSLVS